MTLALHPVDLGILAAYLAGTIVVGLWLGRGQRDISEYLLGGRNLPWWAVLGSIVATETSTVTFLSVPGLAFAQRGDLQFLQLAFGYIVGRIAVVALLLPLYFQGRLFTAYEVLHRRFGGATKTTASVLFLVTRSAADGVRLYLTALPLMYITGFSLELCVVIVGSAMIVYTVAGGMKSVVWNDCAQFIIYIVAALLAGAVILNALPDGWTGLARFAHEHDKLRLFDFRPDWTDPYTFWSGLIGGAFLTLGTHGTDQMMVQRYLSARSQRDAAGALVLSGFVVLLQFALFLGLGIGLAAFYAEHHPELTFAKTDDVFPHFIANSLPVGVAGLTLAAVLSAAMSGSLNSSAAAALNDLYLPYLRTELSELQLVRLSRVLTVFFGIVQVGVGMLSPHFTGSVVNDVLAIAGFTTGIVLGVFLLGVLTRRVSQTAALVGLVGGLSVVIGVKLWTTYGLDAPLAWPWYTILGSLSTFAIGLLASLVWPEKRASTGCGMVS